MTKFKDKECLLTDRSGANRNSSQSGCVGSFSNGPLFPLPRGPSQPTDTFNIKLTGQKYFPLK